MMPEMRLLPSTSSTSPGSMTPRRCSGSLGGKRLVARDFLLQVARNQLADGVEHYAHVAPQARLFFRFFCFLIMVASRFNLVHAQDGSIMIDLP
jgi:hypothetical protein